MLYHAMAKRFSIRLFNDGKDLDCKIDPMDMYSLELIILSTPGTCNHSVLAVSLCVLVNLSS